MLTKYGEIIKEIETRIGDGRLLPGERLPSVRTLSKELHCSINSIIKAYAELEKEQECTLCQKAAIFLLGARLHITIIDLI